MASRERVCAYRSMRSRTIRFTISLGTKIIGAEAAFLLEAGRWRSQFSPGVQEPRRPLWRLHQGPIRNFSATGDWGQQRAPINRRGNVRPWRTDKHITADIGAPRAAGGEEGLLMGQTPGPRGSEGGRDAKGGFHQRVTSRRPVTQLALSRIAQVARTGS